MTTLTRTLAAALLLGLAWPVLAETVPPRPTIADDANLFSKTAKETAQPVLAEIHKLNKEFLIETFPAPPGKVPEAEAERLKFFADWAKERAHALKVNGVYLLICKEPGRFEPVVGTETKKRAFKEADRKELSALLEAKLKAREFDEALDASVAFVRDRMRANLRGENPVTHTRDEYGDNPAAAGDMGWMRWLWIGLAVLIGIWVIRALIVALSGMGSGGSFFGMFMGGLFGAVAGMWIYDSFFGSGSSWGSGDTTGGGDGGGGDAADTDYSGGGGGDFGGGDGGGDF